MRENDKFSYGEKGSIWTCISQSRDVPVYKTLDADHADYILKGVNVMKLDVQQPRKVVIVTHSISDGVINTQVNPMLDRILFVSGDEVKFGWVRKEIVDDLLGRVC